MSDHVTKESNTILFMLALAIGVFNLIGASVWYAKVTYLCELSGFSNNILLGNFIASIFFILLLCVVYFGTLMKTGSHPRDWQEIPSSEFSRYDFSGVYSSVNSDDA